MSQHPSLTTAKAIVLAAVLVGFVSACGDGEPKDIMPPPVTGLSVAKALPSGDGQSGPVQEALLAALQVVVLEDGNPKVGATVNWAGTGTNPSFNPGSSRYN